MPEIKPDRKVDCIGLYCPIPIFKTREEVDKLQPGEVLEVLADDPASEEDIARWAKRTGNEVLEMRKEGSVIRFLIRKK